MGSQVLENYEEWYAAEGLRITYTHAAGFTELGDTQTSIGEVVREACRKASEDNASNTLYGYHRQVVLDGAGNRHVNITCYFRDPTDIAQLNPRNLNSAPTVAFGRVLSEDDIKQAGIGAVESDIKRTPTNQ